MLTSRGLIGPGRLFSKGYMYHPQVWALLIGAVIPIPLWFYVRKWPRSFLRNMNIPVILNGGFSIPPATGVNYSSFFIVGFVFQYLIRRRRFAWWSKVRRSVKSLDLVDAQYNYILSVALDVGSALSALFIFLVLDLTNAKIDWWGNNVYQKSALMTGPWCGVLLIHSGGLERRGSSLLRGAGDWVWTRYLVERFLGFGLRFKRKRETRPHIVCTA
jgi:hypothetical protein